MVKNDCILNVFACLNLHVLGVTCSFVVRGRASREKQIVDFLLQENELVFFLFTYVKIYSLYCNV